MYPFTHNPPKTTQTDMQMPYHTSLLPQSLFTFSPNFSPEFITNQKNTIIPSNSADYPLPGLKCTPNAGTLATPGTLPHMSVHEILPKTIKN